MFGPPQGTYDPEWVAAAARAAEPGLPAEEAHRLAVAAGEHLRSVGGPGDAPALARALLAEELGGGAASAATVVARAAVEFVELYGVELRG